MPFKANNNREAAVVCARHVVKRPTKRSVLVYINMCIYKFICSELIEETERPPGLIFCMWGYFWPGTDKFESWKNFHTFDVRNCHIFESVKNHINAYISCSIRDRTVKT